DQERSADIVSGDNPSRWRQGEKRVVIHADREQPPGIPAQNAQRRLAENEVGCRHAPGHAEDAGDATEEHLPGTWIAGKACHHDAGVPRLNHV
nr:hypothetical protein [Tanacetum cinerariifolium]